MSPDELYPTERYLSENEVRFNSATSESSFLSRQIILQEKRIRCLEKQNQDLEHRLSETERALASVMLDYKLLINRLKKDKD